MPIINSSPDVIYVFPLFPSVKTFEGVALTSTRSGLIYIPVPQDVTIKEVHVEVGANLAGDATWDVRLNNVSMFSGSEPVITAGNKIVHKTGLLEDADLGDDLYLDLLTCPVTGIVSPVTFFVLMQARQ
jgi:hypothetical protein